MCKTHRTQNFRAPRLSWYSFGGIWRPFQPSHLKNHEFYFFTKLPTKPSSYLVGHRQAWQCAKPTDLKTFVHQDFDGIHLGKFLGLCNPHISKITNFIFSENSPPSHLAMPLCTANLGHVQNPPNSKLSCTKTFMVFMWGHLEAFPTLTSQKSRISFFHKTPHQAISLSHGAPASLAMCKTHRPQNFRAPRLSWYSFGDICRPFQPSHLKNHEFHFFTKPLTKPSSYAVVHRQLWPCITHRTQNFRAPRLSWYSFGGIWRPFQPSHFKNHEFHFFTKLPTKPSSYAVMHRHVQNPPNSKLSCTKTFMVFIWGHL